MNYLKTPIEGVYIIEPHRFADPRGYFMETMKLAEFRENVAPGIEFVQANESVSSRGVLRGLHFQRGEFSQRSISVPDPPHSDNMWPWSCRPTMPVSCSFPAILLTDS